MSEPEPIIESSDFPNKEGTMSRKELSETFKNWATVVAVAAGAVWAFYLFTLKELPGLEIRGGVAGSVTISSLPHSDLSEVDYNVYLENSGSTSFDIVKIHTRVWEFDSPKQTEKITFLDVLRVRESKPFFDRTYELNSTSVPFSSHYPPGSNASNTFNWFLKPDCGKWLLFNSEFYEKKVGAPKWSTASWYPECPPSPSPTPTPTPENKH